MNDELIESDVINSEASTSYVSDDWMVSVFVFVTLPRRFHLGIVSGGEVSSS